MTRAVCGQCEEEKGGLADVPYVCYAKCFRAGNRVSGPDFVRILIGRASKSALRPMLGLSRLADIWPGSPISCPEALLRNIGYPNSSRGSPWRLSGPPLEAKGPKMVSKGGPESLHGEPRKELGQTTTPIKRWPSPL